MLIRTLRSGKGGGVTRGSAQVQPGKIIESLDSGQATQIRDLLLPTSGTLGHLLSSPGFQFPITTSSGLRGALLVFAKVFEPKLMENTIQRILNSSCWVSFLRPVDIEIPDAGLFSLPSVNVCTTPKALCDVRMLW